eukprot:CAMPEP_0172487040 /NCGR_PEP_ID=MMETSP1066-20121228/15889_1 /TAXON_ID=671091 /ORGANISM="Coscinodiscus wailesii, Strain CCMP2513" /LENGTH=30 /DNA_ID= /DNA_START= /DNA_END= /DNA_ORIENTATION=
MAEGVALALTLTLLLAVAGGVMIMAIRLEW